ncbi:pro-MCH [Protopterus annectens]|uniref:pro-MCH n=1 Tax=Protopterus annectens TaxID=7888 RepID=UPI001CF9F0F7|nr:pro-MCH [Protopterus annectens]
MSISTFIAILTLMLLSDSFTVSVVSSMRKTDDNNEQDMFSPEKALGDEEPERTPTKPYQFQESPLLNGEDGNQKHYIFRDLGPKMESANLQGYSSSSRMQKLMRPALLMDISSIKLPYLALKEPMTSPLHSKNTNEITQERRETGDEETLAKFPVGRRDFDTLRCMLGRVYRPCWQV